MKQNLLLFLLLYFYTSSAQTTLTGNIGDYTITQPGTYQISGTVVGNITVNVTTTGNVTIEGIGTNPVLQGIPWAAGTPRHVSHFSGKVKNNSTLTWKDIQLRGHNHNLMEATSNCTKVFSNLELINYDRIENGVHYEDVGGLNGGKNSTASNCDIAVGDDAIKITSQNSSASNLDIDLSGNGSAIQLGWGNRCKGANHSANNINITGFLHPNLGGGTVTNDLDRPARSIVAGIIQNNVQNVNITNLNINVSNYRHLIKFLVQDGQTNDPSLDNVLIQGTIPDNQLYNHGAIKAVSIVAKPGAEINNFVVDMGCAIQNPIYHHIEGDVDVTFTGCPSGDVEYVGGVLITPLPIELTQFKAEATKNNYVEISWSTAAEINNDYFLIERSKDTKEWEVINKTLSQSHGIQQTNYALTDKAPYSNQSYYRLKQVDLDGSSSTSVMKSVFINNTAINIAPNPTNSIVIIEEEVAINDIHIFNKNGQNITHSISISKNANQGLTLNFSGLNDGIYYIHTPRGNEKIIYIQQ